MKRQWLKDMRVVSRMRQKEVSQRLYISKLSLSYHEGGKTKRLPFELLESFAKLYKVDFDELCRLEFEHELAAYKEKRA